MQSVVDSSHRISFYSDKKKNKNETGCVLQNWIESSEGNQSYVESIANVARNKLNERTMNGIYQNEKDERRLVQIMQQQFYSRCLS